MLHFTIQGIVSPTSPGLTDPDPVGVRKQATDGIVVSTPLAAAWVVSARYHFGARNFVARPEKICSAILRAAGAVFAL